SPYMLTHISHTLSLNDALPISGAALPPASTIWRGGEGRVARARAIHTSTCFPDRRLAFGPAGNPSGDARTLQAVLAIARQWKLRSEEHTSELQSLRHLVCRLLL